MALKDRMEAAFAYRKSIAAPGERVSQAALARACGVTQPSVSAWFSGDTKSLSGDVLVKAAAYLRVRPEYLAGQSARMLYAPPSSASGNPVDGDAPAGIAWPHAASNASPAGLVPHGSRVPVVGTAQLGDNGHFVEMEFPVGHGDGHIEWPTNDPNAYAVRCRGDSMSPRIQHGEFVIVEPSIEVQPGDEVLLKAKDGRVMVKKYLYHRDGRVHLVSVNDAHPPIVIDEQDVDVIHAVSGYSKKHRFIVD